MAIKILIADDHRILSEAIGTLLNNELGMEVVAYAENGRDAVRLANELKPDIIIMDTDMPDLNGIEATRQITKQMPETKVIALSEQLDKRSVCEMLKAGASSFVSKKSAFAELLSAIRTVASNKTYLSSNVSQIVLDEYLHKSEHGDSAYNVLTAREREVLQLIAEGKSTKAIAKQLFLSIKTIEWHRSRIMNKLDTKSVAKLVKYAIREGLTCAYA